MRLRSIRESSGISGRELAKRIGKTVTYVSKIETGALYPQREVIEQIAGALLLTPHDSNRLFSAYEHYESDTLELTPSNSLERRQRAIDAMVSTATSVDEFSLNYLPGLLQTPRYAESLFRTMQVPRQASKAAVAARVARRRTVISREVPTRCVFHEMALRPFAVPESVMGGQIQFMAKLISEGQISVGILAADYQGRPFAPPASAFSLIDKSVVLLESPAGYVTLRDSVEVDEAVKSFDAAYEACHRDTEALRLLSTMYGSRN
jgi:transcriptional regulator with XRE-family HTH domain